MPTTRHADAPLAASAMFHAANLATEFLLNTHLSCSQAMLTAFGPELGLERDLALRLGAGLGGGLGQTGGICGAVNGGCILLGLALSGEDPAGPDRKQRVYPTVKRFLNAFAERRGSLICREIRAGAGCPAPDGAPSPEELARMRALCPEVVRDAAECLAVLLRERPQD